MKQLTALQRRDWLILGATIALDQASKAAVLSLLSRESGRTSISLGHPQIRFELVYNDGIAFGLFQGQPLLFLLLSICVLVGLFWFTHNPLIDQDWLARLAMSLLIGGGMSNLLDRLIHGAIIDFIDLWWWPNFNLADMAICLGAILLGLRILLITEDGPPAPAPRDDLLLTQLLSEEEEKPSGGQRGG